MDDSEGKPKRKSAKEKRELTLKWNYPKHTFGTAVLELADCGFIDIDSLQGLDDNVFACTVSNHGFAACARELAYLLPGQLRPLKGGRGLVWINGRNGPHGVLIEWEGFRSTMEARETLAKLVPGPYPWTVGSCAKKLIKHIGDKQPYEKAMEWLLDGVTYGYHECTPGRYSNQIPRFVPSGEVQRDLFHVTRREIPNPDYKPAVTMFDVKGYYYQMLRMVPSLYWDVYPTSARGMLMGPETKAAWKDVLDCVEPCKILRNSLAGAFAGSLKPGSAFTRDLDTGGVKEIITPGSPGPFRALGLLLVRSGVELCHREALTHNAIYATIDSVSLLGDAVPTVWQSFGFTVEKKAAGNAEICHRGSYKIGKTQTRNYANGDREYYAVERVPEIPVQYHRSWL